jgi:hypothetical protein
VALRKQKGMAATAELNGENGERASEWMEMGELLRP